MATRKKHPQEFRLAAISLVPDQGYTRREAASSLGINALSYPVSRNRARKLMKEAGVQVKHRKKYKLTANSNHQQPVFDNVLDRQFDVQKPDRVYVADITCL